MASSSSGSESVPDTTVDGLSAAECAALVGIREFSLLLLGAAGCPGGEVYQPTVESLAEVAAFFGVSERTAASWRAKGMPGEPGCYRLPACLDWRLAQKEPEPWHFQGNPNLEPRSASGRLARAILQVLRVELPRSVAAAREDFEKALHGVPSKLTKKQAELVRSAFDSSLRKHLEFFVMTDDEIEQTMIDCWNIV